ncbi:MAG: beta-lactamase family protein [Chthoniobacterales bacterium]|nr:beta-lactamase family protein [Chthoniobacterales bacterium]
MAERAATLGTRMGLERAPLERRLRPLFEENFIRSEELGAAVSIWQNGKPILDLHGGFLDARRETPWTAETIVLFWSATKGLGSACLLHVLQEHEIELDRRVTEFWPEFGQGGKEEINLAQLLSHQAGLCAFDHPVDVQDYAAVVHALERQVPLWPPGTAHGYHARTFGFLLDELVRRLARQTLGEYWRTHFADPLGLDIWIGLPESEHHRAATVYAAKARGRPPEPAQFYRDLSMPGTLVRRTFTSPAGLHAVSGMNAPAIRSLPLVSFGGIGSASSLAKFYAMLANGGELGGRRFFRETTLQKMTTTLTCGVDRVFQIPTAFSAGFMKNAPDTPAIFGPSPVAFGHPGAGGSHAFADPESGLAFSYVMNQMEQSLLPNEKSLRLVDAIYDELRQEYPPPKLSRGGRQPARLAAPPQSPSA